MATELKTRIKLRRDTEANFEAVKESFEPLAGEVCFVVTDSGLRAKVGDGTHVWKDLKYVDQDNQIVIWGYYSAGNNDFYKDSTYQPSAKIERCATHLYIDRNSGNQRFYFFDDAINKYTCVTPEASDTIPGIMKLYQSEGQNTDGTMTQKSITEGVSAIKFAVDSGDTECLVLNAPW